MAMSFRMRSALASILAGLLSGCATSFYTDVEQDTAWQVRETAHFVIHYRAGSPAERDIDKIAVNAETDRALILAGLDVSCEAVINYYLYNVEEGEAAIGIHYGGYAMATFMTIRQTYQRINDGRASKHEMVHAIASCTLGESRYRVLTEGLAIAMQGTYYNGRSIPEWMRGFWGQYQTLTISQLITPGLIVEPQALYVQDGCFVGYLMDRYGVASFKQFYPTVDFREGLQRVYGLTLPELEAEYHEYLALTFGSADGRFALASPQDGRVRLARKSAPALPRLSRRTEIARALGVTAEAATSVLGS
jgi:hypothetical protein